MVTIVRKLCSAILAGLTVFAAGCSGPEQTPAEPTAPMTAEILYENMLSALSASPPTSGSGEAEVKLTVDAGLFSLDTAVSARAEAALCHEPFGLYVTGNLSGTLPGADFSRDVRVYGGEKNVYCHLDAADLWLRFPRGEASGEADFAVKPRELTLEEQASGYVLRGALTIEKPEALAGTVLRGECHVDRESCLPTLVRLETEEIPEAAQDYVNQLLNKAGLGLPTAVTALKLSVSELDYEPKAVPTVPQEGIDAGREISDLTGMDLLKLLK